MDETIKNIKTAEELTKYLSEHSEKNIPYDQETTAYIQKLLRKFGLSRNVLRIHYEIPKK